MDKLDKLIIAMICIIIVLIAILSAIIMYSPAKQEQGNEKIEAEVSKSDEENNKVSEVILDECTDEYEEMEEEIISTNFEQEKVSPNCKITLVKHYKVCDDEINEYIKVPDDLVNCTQEELQNEYKDWEIKEFSSGQITLYKEFDGECGEHYILKDDEGKITIYKINENGEEAIYEKTEVSTDYLPEKDSNSIRDGLKVNGKEKLNALIESFQ